MALVIQWQTMTAACQRLVVRQGKAKSRIDPCLFFMLFYKRSVLEVYEE
jgi:hypothetical protein